MKPQDVRNIARIRGVRLGTYSRTDSIKTLQAAGGDFGRLAAACGGI